MASKHRVTVGEELRYDSDFQGLKNLGGTYALKAALDPRDYGAKGDGVTDDTAALQAWLNAVTSTSATGVLPARTFVISDWLSISQQTSRWKIDGGGATIRQAASNKGHFRFTKQNTWGFKIEHLHLTWSSAQPASNTLAIAIAFDTDGTPGIDGSGYYNFQIDRLRLSNGFRGIAQYADNTTASAWGCVISNIHANSSMVGSIVNLRSSNGAPNVTVKNVYARGDNATEECLYLSNIGGGLVESIELNSFATSQEITINNSDSVVLKTSGPRTLATEHPSPSTVRPTCTA